MTSVSLQDRRRAAYARWSDSPLRFVIEALGATPDEWQVEALKAIVIYRRISVVACHGVGKDTLMAWLILWVMCTKPHCKNPITAPTGHQLYDLAWSELSLWFGKLPNFVRVNFEINTDTFYNKKHKLTWFTAARTARKEKAEGLQGFHAPTVFIGVDEASGVEEIAFEVLEGATTGDYYMYWAGNPTRVNGSFFRSHTTDDRFFRIGVAAANGYDPTVHGPLPKHYFLSHRPTVDYCRNVAKRYGLTSAVYGVRVLGKYAESSPDTTIPFEWVSEAFVRPVEFAQSDKKIPIVAGLDIALSGTDDCALVVRQGPVILGIWSWHNFNEDQTVTHVIQLLNQLKMKNQYPDSLFVDRIGPGKDIFAKLASHSGSTIKCAVVGVHVGETSPDETCALLRDCLWWRGRKFFEVGSTYQYSYGVAPSFGPDVNKDLADRLQAELSVPTYRYTPGRKIKVEGKEELAARGVDSPDVADAFLLTLYSVQTFSPPTEEDEMERELSQRFGGRKRRRYGR